jgi:hypothetical protein
MKGKAAFVSVLLGLTCAVNTSGQRSATTEQNLCECAVDLVPSQVTATNSWSIYKPENVLKGTGWNAGDYAPQSIGFRFDPPALICQVRLRAQQDPPGPTRHRVSGMTSAQQAVELGVLSGVTAAGQWLKLDSTATEIVQSVQVTTESSPSWVAWEKIEFRGVPVSSRRPE